MVALTCAAKWASRPDRDWIERRRAATPGTWEHVEPRPCEYCDHGVGGGEPCRYPDCHNGIIYDTEMVKGASDASDDE